MSRGGVPLQEQDRLGVGVHRETELLLLRSGRRGSFRLNILLNDLLLFLFSPLLFLVEFFPSLFVFIVSGWQGVILLEFNP